MNALTIPLAQTPARAVPGAPRRMDELAGRIAARGITRGAIAPGPRA